MHTSEGTPQIQNESGQSLVLIALLIVLLLAFAGLATDVGMLFARSSQFSAAVDAATLAGVVELVQPGGNVTLAHDRADEFMDANRWQISPLDGSSSGASESTTPLGYPQFHYTVTFPVETYFLSLLGFSTVPITHDAAASIYSWADMPAATQADQGILRTAGQYIYGPESCTSQGDPVSARWRAGGLPNPLHTESGGKYTYRIRVPDDYSNALEVQLFDPDSLNTRSGSTDTIYHSNGDPPSSASCSTMGDGDSCLIPTGETTNASFNQVWLRRVDETWQSGTSGTCPMQDANNASGNTVTRYDLFHLDENNNRIEIVAFESGSSTDQHTDMRWVTPGSVSYPNVPALPGLSSSFLLDATVVDDIPIDEDGFRNIYLDVQAAAGTSKNGWDIWAGRPDEAAAARATGNDKDGNNIIDGNERNLFVLENLSTLSNEGIEIFALGYLPIYSYFPDQLQLPLVSVSQALGGSRLSISVFDFEPPSVGPFQFNYSSVTTDDWPTVQRNAECNGSSNCDNAWVTPTIELDIPNPDSGVAFYGGYLTAGYTMYGDEHVWHATLPLGRPFLTR